MRPDLQYIIEPGAFYGASRSNALYVHANFHASTLAAIDLAVSRFSTNNKLRADFGLLNNVLPAQAVAVFFLNSTGHQQRVLIFQPQILNDLTGIYHRRHAAFLIRCTTSTDQLRVDAALTLAQDVEDVLGDMAAFHQIGRAHV